MVGRRHMLNGLGVASLGAVAGFGGLLRVLSPGKPPPVMTKTGGLAKSSVSEKVFHDINGVRQGMIIQSANIMNPVLLFLHGGPGMPEFFLNITHPTGLEQDFTVVWWEQRGAGLSFGPDIAPQTMTLAQMIADTISVTDLLRHRFGKDKIYLMGHSWGSYLGIQVAAAAPDRYHAYISMGQVVFQLKSEVAAHGYMLDQYRARGNAAMVRKLMAAPANMKDGLSAGYLDLRDAAMHGLGIGTTRDMSSVITGVFIPVWQCRAYTMREKVDIWRGLAYSRGFLWDDFIATDLMNTVHSLDLPVYFFQGIYDYTANHALARALFDQIKAPAKAFYTFANSAHSPVFEEPHLARHILARDVLGQDNRMRDGPQAG